MKERYPVLIFLLDFFERSSYAEMLLSVVVFFVIIGGYDSIQNITGFQIPFTFGSALAIGGAILIGGIVHGLWTIAVVEFFRCVTDIEKNTRPQ